MVEDAHLVHALVTPLGTDVTVPGEFGAATGKRKGHQDGSQHGLSHPRMMDAGRTPRTGGWLITSARTHRRTPR